MLWVCYVQKMFPMLFNIIRNKILIPKQTQSYHQALIFITVSGTHKKANLGMGTTPKVAYGRK